MPTPRLAILLLAIAWLPTCILSAQTDSSTPADQPDANQPTDENAPQTPSDPEPADSVNESSTQSTDDSAAENENTAPAEAEPETQQTETQENTPLETAEKVEMFRGEVFAHRAHEKCGSEKIGGDGGEGRGTTEQVFVARGGSLNVVDGDGAGNEDAHFQLSVFSIQ